MRRFLVIAISALAVLAAGAAVVAATPKATTADAPTAQVVGDTVWFVEAYGDVDATVRAWLTANNLRADVEGSGRAWQVGIYSPRALTGAETNNLKTNLKTNLGLEATITQRCIRGCP